jgi:hypothetical protein
MKFTDFMFYGGLSLCIAYLSYIYRMQKIKTKERNEKINFAKEKYQKAQNDYIETTGILFKEISEGFGSDIADKVAKGTIWIGMPIYLLVIAKGIRLNEYTSLIQGIRVEKWYYEKYRNRLGNIKYGLEITLIDNKVTGWKYLDVGTSSYRID